MSSKKLYEKTFTITPSKKSTEVAEAFGISGGHDKTVVDVELPEPLPQITYLTGESGCGKTTLLSMLSGDTKVYSHDDYEPQSGNICSWADSVEKGIEYCSKAGLGDSTLFLSEYDELSDSQQYRAMLYDIVLDNPDTLYIDEFLSTLDRSTAKPVSYLFQKLLRRNDISAVLSTAHDDLTKYLQPDLQVTGKAFPSEWSIQSFDQNVENPIKPLEFEWKDNDWYRECRLAELHYKGKYVGGVKDYLACYYDNRLVGLLIATYRMHDAGRRISRLVTHPSYRSCGVGQRIVQRYLEKEPNADVVAQMAKYNPVFERAGMERVENSVVRPPSGLTTDLKEAGFDKQKWYDESYCREFMGDKENRRVIAEYASDVGRLVRPSGKNLSNEKIKEKLLNEAHTSGRVLWNVRKKEMAKFVGSEDL
jgi:ABC-type ATPase fused to a predicted acetyltransferase domain